MIGSIVLSLALASSIIAMSMYYFAYRGNEKALNYGRIFYHAMAMLVIIASTILLYYILTHQYQYKYVFSYSSTDLPLGHLISTFWAGQEGSFMLWLLFTSVVGIFLQFYSSKRENLEPSVMAVFSLSTSFLLIMVSPLFKNPFAFIWAEPIFIEAKFINSSLLGLPFLQNFMFSDNSTGQNFIKMTTELYTSLQAAGVSVNEFIIQGKGLNPQLLNFWMQIHPPILFIGFSMATVPYAFAVAAMMKNDYRYWVKRAFPWVLSGMAILGLGIMLGGYWAYEMLGWGGYWAWDPVENSSLIPWLVGVASIHTLLVQRKSQAKGENVGRFAKTNLILSILTYVLVLYSTFLTRSGILGDASVHSFVDPGTIVYLFLIIFIGSFIVLGFGMIIYRWKYLTEQAQHEENLLSRELSLFTAAIILSASAIIVFVGTSAPIFGQSVDTFFYDEMHIPLAIIVGLLNGLSLLLKWKETKGKDILQKSFFSVSAAVVLTILVFVFGKVTDLMMTLLTFSSAFAFFVNAEIAYKIIKGNRSMLGAYVAHMGIALFLLGVIGSAAYSKQTDVDLVRNQPVEAFGYTLTFTGYHAIENSQKFAFNIEMKKGNKTYKVQPVMYVSEYNNSLVREPDILSMITKDFYISPLGYDEGHSSSDHQNGKVISLSKGETSEFEGVKITFNEFDFPEEARSAMMTGGDFEIGAKLTIQFNGKNLQAQPAMKGTNGNMDYVPFELKDANLRIQMTEMDAGGKVNLLLTRLDTAASSVKEAPKETLSVTASVKPFINLVWTGVVVMVAGFFIAVARRLKESLI